ncbi:ribosomal protein S18-alanine N-acetyltransferase [Desulfomarina sp.]
MIIRAALPADLEEILAIEDDCPFGWSREMVAGELEGHPGIQLVAEQMSTLSGWCCGTLVVDEAELHRIAVLNRERKRGVAFQLLQDFERRCASQNVSSVFLEVAEKNIPGRRLYEKSGYVQVGRRKNYYSRVSEDALVLKKNIP